MAADGDPESDAVASGPYREPLPLRGLIPPDRRRIKAAALLFVGMIAGATVLRVCQKLEVMAELHDRAAAAASVARAAPQSSTKARISASLSGRGSDVTLPMSTPAVVNVWLQGCADCAPAFEAAAALERSGGLGADVPVVNVAYGEADPEWAEAHGVGKSLVFDPSGREIVHPLGIGTFTTLVIDEQGYVRHMDRPGRPGYRDRVVGAFRELERHSGALDPTRE